MGRCAVPTVAVLFSLAAGPASAAEPPFTGEIALELDDAVFQAVEADGVTRFHGLDDEIPAVLPRPLVLDLSCVTGTWDRVWGVALSFNQADHPGRVLKAEIDPDRARFVIQMKIEGDPWVAGGRGEYAIDLRRDGSRLQGAYAGTYRGRDVKGLASGEILPPRLLFPAGFVPAAPGEHPRMLFRRSDLPALRQKAETPFGRPLVAAMKAATDDPVAMGMLWQLEGERAWAERARQAADRLIALGGQAGPFNLPHAVGERLAAVALAFDLCYDAWTPEARAKVLGYLIHYAERTILRPQHLSRKMNFSPSSNYHAAVRGGGGMAGLAFWGEAGPAPEPPPEASLEPLPVAPPPGFEPGDGVPVVPFDSDRSPGRWLLLGPFPFATSDDVLEALGGCGAAHPAEGTEVACRGETRVFQPLDAAFVDTAKGVDLARLLEGAGSSTICLYTVLAVDRPATVQFAAGHPNAAVFLSGRRIPEGDFLSIAPGRHPLMVQLGIGQAWGAVRPRFAPVTADRARKVLAARHAERRADVGDWREDRLAWDRSGGLHPHLMRLFKLGELQVTRYFLYGMGDGGWQTEGEAYTLHSSPTSLAYAHCYRTMFGRLPSSRPNVSRFAPRYVMQTVFPGGGLRPIALSDSLSDGTLASRHYARAYSVTEEAYQPAVLWAWNRILEAKGEEGLDGGAKEDDEDRAMRAARLEEGEDAVFLFVAYPLDREPKNPAGVLPHAWAAPTRGGYVFRNGWAGADDIVAQVFLKSLPANGWSHPTAGTIRLVGLGRIWGDDGEGNPKGGNRWCENVVVLPDDETAVGLGARVTHYAPRPNGSGVIAFDLEDVYRGAKRVKDATGREHPARLTDQMFRTLRGNLVDLGIAGTRSVAVDYGGTSGAPALLAVADRVTGGGRKIWTWQVPGAGRDTPEVAVDGNAFTLKRGDATLRATFVSPADAKVEVVSERRKVPAESEAMEEIPLHAVRATGGTDGKAGDFFVVMTLQRGAAPAVKIEGEGMTARVTVGGQEVRFDGEKLVLLR